MTDGEKARIRDAFSLVTQAAKSVKTGCPEYFVYTAFAMTLGWVLDEKGFRECFAQNLDRIKRFGVEEADEEKWEKVLYDLRGKR